MTSTNTPSLTLAKRNLRKAHTAFHAAVARYARVPGPTQYDALTTAAIAVKAADDALCDANCAIIAAGRRNSEALRAACEGR